MPNHRRCRFCWDMAMEPLTQHCQALPMPRSTQPSLDAAESLLGDFDHDGNADFAILCSAPQRLHRRSHGTLRVLRKRRWHIFSAGDSSCAGSKLLKFFRRGPEWRWPLRLCSEHHGGLLTTAELRSPSFMAFPAANSARRRTSSPVRGSLPWLRPISTGTVSRICSLPTAIRRTRLSCSPMSERRR